MTSPTFLHLRDGLMDRLTFQRNVALLAFTKAAADLLAITAWPDTDPTRVVVAWLNPFSLLPAWLAGGIPSVILWSTILFFIALILNSALRARHAGWNPWTSLLTALPFAGFLLTIILAFLPPKKRSIWDILG